MQARRDQLRLDDSDGHELSDDVPTLISVFQSPNIAFHVNLVYGTNIDYSHGWAAPLRPQRLDGTFRTNFVYCTDIDYGRGGEARSPIMASLVAT